MGKLAGYSSEYVHANYNFQGTATPADGTVPLIVAPYGGLTVKSAYAWTAADVAAHASNYLTVKLLNMGTSGTVNGGTVATGPGTATGFAGGVPGACSVVAAADELSVGQVLTVVFDVNGTIAPKEAGVIVEFVRGQG